MQAIRSISRAALVAGACALSLQAQCLDSNTGATVGSGDDNVLAAQTLPFAFPFNGSTYTTIHPSTNGFVYLSNGTTTGGSGCCTGAIATMVAAPSPMIAPWWTDLNMTGTGSVKVSSSASKAVITWENAVEFGQTTQFSFQLWLTPAGEIDFVYDSRLAIQTHTLLAGMSPGAGATVPPASVLSATGLTGVNTLFQTFNVAGPQSVTGLKLQFLPTNPGFVWVPSSCSATHTNYGAGCYNIPASFYQFTTTAAAAAAMSNTAITLLKTGAGYTTIPLGTYVPPSGTATALTLTDDSETSVTLSSPFPYFGGTTTSLTVCSNGFVSTAVGNGTGFTPTVATFLNGPQAGWWAWKDFNPTIAGSGQVKFEEVGGVAYITWDGVSHFGTTGTGANQTTQQFQFDLATGNVAIVYGTVGTTPATTNQNVLLGYSPAGSSIDPGSITLPPVGSISTPGLDISSLALGASPAPISTPSAGSVVTYTTSNIPELVPSSGLYVALSIISLGQVPAPGLDLGFIGAPGCAALVQSLDFTQSMVGISSTQSVTLTIPAGVPAGTFLYSQSAALITPNSLPNGQNAFGLTTSNGIASRIDVQ